MEVVRDTDGCGPPGSGSVVTIGAYDGVHAGHRAVIDRVRASAQERGLRSVVVTFDRHPAAVVRPTSAPRLLCDLDQKLELLAETGVDRTLVLTFDEPRSQEPAEDFVRRVLVDCLGARRVIVGADFHFGFRRAGNVALLEKLGPEYGFDVDGLDLIDVDNEPVSSTAIRQLLVAGAVSRARDLLGRPHEVRGLVVEGDRRGRTLGFPTANVSVPGDILLPADGVYAGWFVGESAPARPAAISLGRRPQFYEEAHASLLEAHVLDFDGDLYGQSVAVRFVEHLRAEAKFDSVDALVAQIQADCDRARSILARA